MRLALAQINTTVGDLDGNRQRILTRLTEAKEAAADVVLFPELAVTGYPPEDLLLRPGFLRAARRSLDRSPRRPTASCVSSVLPTSIGTSSTPVRSARTERSRPCTTSAFCRTTACSTRIGTFKRAASCSWYGSARRSSGRRCARTSGSPGRPQPTSPSRARTSSRTSPPLRFTSGRGRSASGCCPSVPGTTCAGSRS